jgi:hypothetical protein
VNGHCAGRRKIDSLGSFKGRSHSERVQDMREKFSAGPGE